MAERRMFAKSIIDSDAFLDMPITARLLYYDLGMRADDDGFVNSPKKILRIIGASQDDLSILCAKNFVIPFDDGVIVIKHWKINNSIRVDRKKDTNYPEKLALLEVKENGVYRIKPDLQPLDNQVSTKCQPSDAVGKDSIGEDSIGEDIYSSEPPTVDPEPQPLIYLPLNDKSEYGVTQKEFDEYSELYPAVDIMQALRSMRGWCLANPSRCKTRRGIHKFMNTWLSKEQDKGRIEVKRTQERQDGQHDDPYARYQDA